MQCINSAEYVFVIKEEFTLRVDHLGYPTHVDPVLRHKHYIRKKSPYKGPTLCLIIYFIF